jgi:hypothetical protein
MREEIAWLLWCLSQGYTKPEDRAILDNWFLADESTLTVGDLEEKVDLLLMADQVIAAVKSNA